MAVISPGQPTEPPRKFKKQTSSTNTHRFEPFSKRIARLRIDPVHRVQQNEPIQEDAELSQTYFGHSLNHWAELNLSENFTQFVREVKPLSESLPQILHHADSIFGLLLRHIGKKDMVSSEPLLDLLSHFAHDLGVRFEKYFEEAVRLVSSVAATHEASEVIEWSFSCLAWMLKFLSRLLVPNLRPLLTIMRPYLGGSRQKPYVIRFAAESMAFLVRKAGALYHKNKSPLENVVSHVFEDLRRVQDKRDKSSYQIGLMSLFSESVRGIDGVLHSSSIEVFSCLIDHTKKHGDTDSSALEVLEGTIISVIHETRANGFSPLVKLVLDFSHAIHDPGRSYDIAVAARLLLIIIGTRKGSRINDWVATLETSAHIGRLVGELPPPFNTSQQDMVTTIAMAFQYCPLDVLLPFTGTLVDLFSLRSLSRQFLPFCLLSDQVGHDRFQSLVLPHLQRYITREWQHNQSGLCLLVRRLNASGVDVHVASQPTSVTDQTSIEEEILQTLCADDGDLDLSYVSKNALAQFAEDVGLLKRNAMVAKYVESLRLRTLNALQSREQVHALRTEFETGRGFKTYVRLAKSASKLDDSLWEVICSNPALPITNSIFLAALLEYLQALDMAKTEYSQVGMVLARLVDNLLSRAGDVKALSVRLMQQIIRQNEVQNLLSVVLQILEIPYGLDTVRQITMLIRRLVGLQRDVRSDALFQKIIPFFCLGLVSANSGPIVQEVHSAISAMCEDSAVEDIVSGVAIKCLQTGYNPPATHDYLEDEQATTAKLTRYQCSNIQNVKDLVQKGFSLFDEPKRNLDKMLIADVATSNNAHPSMTRLQALQVFKSIPLAAEKRSRSVVPVFLSMQPAQDCTSLSFEPATSTSSHTMSPELVMGEWSYPDRRAFLELLAKFKNPKVLYKSQDVFDALLEFLTAGQSEIQKLALHALFTWKLPSIRKYEESLLKLTDEKTYRDELTTLFHTDAESSSILDEDRSELLPILLRLLFGQMISRSGAKANHGSQESKRKSTLRMLFKMQYDEVALFLDIAFGTISIDVSTDGGLQNGPCSIDMISVEKQHGLVRTAESMLETLQSQLAPFGERVLAPVLYCLYRACQRLNKTKDSDEISNSETKDSIFRSIRRSAMHCLCMMLTCCDGIKWSTHLPSIFKYVIEPRLEKFAVETAQGVSGLLQLFGNWASDAKTVPYFNLYNDSLLEKVADCLITPSARDDVKIYVLDQVFLKLSQLAPGNPDVKQEVLSVIQPHIQYLLRVIGSLLESKENRKVLDSAVALLASLTPFVDSSVEAERLISAVVTLLNESSDRVGPRVKGNLLQAVLHLMKLCSWGDDYLAQPRLRKTISSLFNYFKDTRNRCALAEILTVLYLDDAEGSEIASLCSGLNAVSSGKLDDIDYDTRLEAFTVINAKAVENFSSDLWEPIIQNLVYFARAADDFAIRSNAVSSLRRFILDASEIRQPDFEALLHTIILEGLKKVTKADSESVRADHVALFGLLVQQCPDWTEVSDMRGLLADNDEDASFFNNILHIQHHRRTRALRRLAAEAERGVLRSSNICTFFLPLLEKFIFDSNNDEGVRDLRGQAIATVGVLLQWTEWSQFRAIFRRYKSYINSKPEAEKDVIKLLGISATALVCSSSTKAGDQDTDTEITRPTRQKTRLANSLPNLERLTQELTTHFIPDLADFIHQKDEFQVTSRIPVAITTVKLLKILPQAEIAQFLPPLLLDIAYILRSRSQDSRDVARRTLAEVTTILGPSCIHWILKELRTALARGYQLHVLSYTIHSILVSNTDYLKIGDLDHCIEGLVAVVMDDIFGTVGQEKDEEDYISKMREVKSSKSFDSMELLAKSTTIQHLVKLIRPLLALLTGNISSKQSRQVDELLRRIGLGLSRNPVAGTQDMLMFSYEVIQQLYNDMQPADKRPMTKDEGNRHRFLVQLSGANKSTVTKSSPFLYKLAKFALDVVRSTLQKHENLLKPENVHGFLPIIGDALVQAQEDVKISAMRLLSAIIKLPMPELEDNAALYVIEAVKVVKDSMNTNGEAAQAAIKLIAAILRERRSMRIRDSDLIYLLRRIMPDLEEPDRQGVTFNLVKAVMARKIMLPEVYDVSKKIGMIMITSHGQSARDAARGIFVHFVLEFPQSTERWNKQIKFLVKNLNYQYPEGRQSAMEAVNMLLNKTGDIVAQELIARAFIPLVLIMANDDNAECRQMAGALLSRCFEKADREQMKSLLGSLRGWVQQSDNPALGKVGMQAFKILFQLPDVQVEKEVPALLSAIYQILKELSHGEEGETWETLYHALQLFSKITAVLPALAMNHQQSSLWSRIGALLTYPHPWVQASAAGLVGIWLHDAAVANGKSSLGVLPLVGSHGLQLTAEAQLDFLRSSLRVLKRNWSSKDLSAQLVRNLVFLGRCFNANNLGIDTSAKPPMAPAENSDSDTDDQDSDTENATSPTNTKTPAITHLLTHLSSILRHEPRKLTTQSLLPKQSSLTLFSALLHHISPSTLLPLLPTPILPPLAHLTSPTLATPHPNTASDPAFSATFQQLISSAAELLDLLQKKVGSAEYVKAMTQAQKLMREKREGRRVKRKMDLLADPEGAAREKKRRGEKERRRVKGRGEGFRKGRRGM